MTIPQQPPRQLWYYAHLVLLGAATLCVLGWMSVRTWELLVAAGLLLVAAGSAAVVGGRHFNPLMARVLATGYEADPEGAAKMRRLGSQIRGVISVLVGATMTWMAFSLFQPGS